MDEDIDIEEHDVLDNPKIRDIFPDLSLVKIEAPDENEQDHYEVPLEFEVDLDQACNIKKEILSDDENDFMALSYDHDTESNACHYNENDKDSCGIEQSVQSSSAYEQNGSTYEQNNSAFEQNDNAICNYDQSAVEQSAMQIGIGNEYNFANKIILGSKPQPCLDYDTLYKEALESIATVALEDWNVRLNSSPCYCHSCEILFPTVNALDAHKGVKHSLLVAMETPKHNTARKSTAKSSFCHHCNKTFPNYNVLIKHLYQLLPLNNFQERSPAVIKDEADPNIRYKCGICEKFFETFAEGKRHKEVCHSRLKNAHIILCKKLETNPTVNPTTSIAEEGDQVVKKKFNKSKLVASSNLVPKSVLFQCHICLVGFLSCFSASQHAKTCENKTEYRQCSICKRKIRTTDFEVHLLQHKFNDKLRIYTLNKKLYEKLIVKCPTCKICFDEKDFWCHRKTCKGEIPPYSQCNICNVNIVQSRYHTHKAKHVLKKFTKKDFILVEFYDLNEPIKSKGDDYMLYFCETCRSCKTMKSERGHMKGACKNYAIKYCSICGLGFTRQDYGIHRIIHTKTNLSIKDFKIISLKTDDIIIPPIPDLHRCQHCKIHFLFKKNVLKHKCRKEHYETCKYCNKKFNFKAFPSHVKFHEYKGDTDMPKLLKMYNSINSIWNIVYMCVNCNIVTGSYDGAVEHSQNHICGSQKPIYQKCDICNFNIIDKDYGIHINLHENNAKISRKEFTILKFNYKDMYKKKWMDIFLPLPKEHKYQILAKSIYRCTRRFKLNCEINCRTDDTKFFCKNCKSSIDMEDMKKHYFDQQCKYSSKYVCSHCKMTFKNLLECVAHEAKHDNANKTYKVYTFNDRTDEEFNQKLLDFDCDSVKSDIKPPSIVSPKRSSKKFISKTQNKMAVKKNKMAVLGGKRNMAVAKNSKFKIFKCKTCQSCVCLQRNVMTHKCSKRRKGICHICKNTFFSRNISTHIKMHRYYGKKPSIIYFDPNSLNPLKKAVLYKCDCGLHFTSRQSVDNHLTICNDKSDISKEVCSKCKLLFPTDVLVTHLCKHHIKSVNIKIDIVNISKKGLFECAVCASVYSNMNNFDIHLFHCPLKNNKTCDNCNVNINFTDKHKCTPGLTPTVIKKSISTVTLYKCVSCNLHYFLKKGLKYHMDQNHVVHRKIVACDICKLKFTEQVIHKHMELHATEQYYMIKIIDSVGRQRIIKGQNIKIDSSTSRKRDLAEVEVINDDKVKEDSALDNIKPSISKGNRKAKSVKRNITDESVTYDEKLVTNDSCSEREVYRCNLCNICYVYKKNWYYHIEVNHVNKRGIKICEVCGLTFISSALAKHSVMHQDCENYLIKVIEPDTTTITFLKGKNAKVTEIEASKRNANNEDGPLRKRVKRNHDESRYIDDDQEPSTSKLDFKSVYMTVDEKESVGDESDIYVDDFETIKEPLVDATKSISPSVTKNDNINANDKIISHKMKVILNANCDVYDETLYKCEFCCIHFLTDTATKSHFKRTSVHEPSDRFKKCSLCGLTFTTLTLIRHIYIHHRKMKLNKNFNIITVSSRRDFEMKRIRKSVNNISEVESTQIDSDIDDDMEDFNATIETENYTQNDTSINTSEDIEDPLDIQELTCKDNNIDNIINTTNDIEQNKTISNTTVEENDTQKDTSIEEANEIDINNDTNATNDFKENDTCVNTTEATIENTQKVSDVDMNTEDIDTKDVDTKVDTDERNNTKIQYHKCGDCNVCFIDEDACRKHCTPHKLLDPKTYIECKICNFQFMIDSLKDHIISQHETEFHLEDLIITEYTSIKDNCLKIDTYKGIDKVQSKLISTTTDLTNT